jgi:aminoglycoside phosphotransferase (APT) family kinase protein
MPGLVALEQDPAYLGMPFYVMERLRGHVPVQWQPEDPLAFPDEDARRRLGEQFVDVLAEIHAIDWRDAGLTDLGETEDGDAAARMQLEHWERYYTDARLVEIPSLRRAIGWLHANVAASGRVALVHGDYRLGNFMIDDQRRINGVFDWELAHVSDPVEDIAYSGLRLFRGRSPLLSHLLPAADYFARYQARTGLTIAPDVFRWWTVLGYLKASASHLRAARAFEDGANGDLRLAAMGHQVLYVLRGLEQDLPRGG